MLRKFQRPFSGYKSWTYIRDFTVVSSISLSEIDCVAVDGFGMLNLLQKTAQIEIVTDLVNAGIPGIVPKICFSKREILKFKPTTL